MKDVTGGVYPYCVMNCATWIGGAMYTSTTYVGSCTAESELACSFGGEVTSCVCGVM